MALTERGCFQVEEIESTSLIDNDAFKTPTTTIAVSSGGEMKEGPSGGWGSPPVATPKSESYQMLIVNATHRACWNGH